MELKLRPISHIIYHGYSCLDDCIFFDGSIEEHFYEMFRIREVPKIRIFNGNNYECNCNWLVFAEPGGIYRGKLDEETLLQKLNNCSFYFKENLFRIELEFTKYKILCMQRYDEMSVEMHVNGFLRHIYDKKYNREIYLFFGKLYRKIDELIYEIEMGIFNELYKE